jgi:hypothetical protein
MTPMTGGICRPCRGAPSAKVMEQATHPYSNLGGICGEPLVINSRERLRPLPPPNIEKRPG